jgi:hypothetical protein
MPNKIEGLGGIPAAFALQSPWFFSYFCVHEISGET